MKIEVLSKAYTGDILELITYINKTDNLTALLLPETDKDGNFVIRIESL